MKFVLLLTLFETLALTLWMAQLWHARTRHAKAAPVVLQPSSSSRLNNVLSPRVSSRAAAHWTSTSDWQVEPQADDRILMDGAVASNAGSPSARRAFARRSHQINYKAWSRARRD